MFPLPLHRSQGLFALYRDQYSLTHGHSKGCLSRMSCNNFLGHRRSLSQQHNHSVHTWYCPSWSTLPAHTHLICKIIRKSTQRCARLTGITSINWLPCITCFIYITRTTCIACITFIICITWITCINCITCSACFTCITCNMCMTCIMYNLYHLLHLYMNVSD